ncbi:unnamed protein product [Caenorhabditis angaria]|uniref:Uncharacterized protein n=1 Tax=Caenorhabditis angaria TaxID=860376 RepID=A0A9P1MSF2_9PELO|nr:unnamed protein product [Caenorhabditis angaria]
MKNLAIFILFFLAASPILATKFNFQVTLKCSKIDYYHYSVAHFDHDTFTKDDQIGGRRLGEANGDVTIYSKGEQSDDGVSLMYQVYSSITHNCTSKGEERKLKINLGNVDVFQGQKSYKYDAILNNNGTKA